MVGRGIKKGGCGIDLIKPAGLNSIMLHYADAAGKTQVSGMDVLIPAKGHTEGEPEKGDVTPADCESVGGYNLTTRCKVCGRVLSVERIVIPMTAHEWSVWSMTIAPTENTDGEKRRSCSICGTVETRIVPKLAPGGDPNQKGTDGTAVGPGASAAAASTHMRRTASVRKSGWLLNEIEERFDSC